MKVLILSHSSDLGGAEQSMLGLFGYLTKTTDIEPEFIIRKPLLKLANELDKQGYTYHKLYYTNWAQRNLTYDSAEMYWYAKQNTAAVKEIERLIKEVKPQVVMTNTVVAPWAAIAAYRLNIPHVWFIREFGDADRSFEFRLGQSKTFEAVGKMSNLVVANSKALAKFASKYADKTKITILYPTLESEKIQQTAMIDTPSPFKDPDSLKLVITGRIAESKGQHIAASAVGILNKQGIKTELCVIGAPSSRGDDSALITAIKNYKIENEVHLLGHQKNPLNYVVQADIGIMASVNEAFGRVTLEYMTLGKPVVGANSGATPELIKNNSNGFLYDPKSSDDLAKKLLKYADNRELIKKQGKNSKLRAASLLRGGLGPDNFYKQVSLLSKNTQKNNNPEPIEHFISYPVLIDDHTIKPPFEFTWQRLISGTRRLLKSIYILLS